MSLHKLRLVLVPHHQNLLFQFQNGPGEVNFFCFFKKKDLQSPQQGHIQKFFRILGVLPSNQLVDHRQLVLSHDIQTPQLAGIPLHGMS